LYNPLMPEWIGKTIGKVRVDKQLAKGGMAEVYLGTHLTLDRPVAIKVMHNYIEADPDLQSRFEREAKVVAGLRHPNIVQIFDFDTGEGHPYIVMEYLKGPSLAEYLRTLHERGKTLRPAQVAHILSRLAAALDYAHEEGVIHRDIKPSNIILRTKTGELSPNHEITDRVEPIITDFGLVRIAQSTKQTASGVVSGTPAYMSPEQAQGAQVDYRSDIYSLGVVLYELLAGRVPFEGESSWTVILKHINESPPPIPGMQPAVQNVINRALAKKPEERYQSCGEFAGDYVSAIGFVSQANTIRMSLPPTPEPVTASEKRGQPADPASKRVAAFSLAVIFLIALAIWGSSTFLSPRSTAEPGAIGAIGEEAAVGLLRFQDGTAPADQVTISTSNMALPPEGSRYEAWLIQDDGEQRISIGAMEFDQQKIGSLTFVDGEGQNLLGKYITLEITIEPDPDPSPNSSNDVAFSVSLPPEGFTHVRHLLFSFNATPQKIGFIRGLDADTILLNELAQQMLASFEAGAETDLGRQVERMLNVILGSQSEDHKDWNADGRLDDPGDGFGLLLNGENLGYIQGTFTHADLSLTSPDATQNMLIHGEHVKICAVNIDEWTSQLRAQLIAILESPFDSPELEGRIREAVALADKIRNGIDLNGDENVEPIAGEGGTLTAYEHAYYMADMVIFPPATETIAP
jgi:serine/threonine protein kinase